MRSTLDQNLHVLYTDIIKMGTLIEKAIDDTITALVNHDCELAKKVYEGDNVFDDMTKDIENKCIGLIARRQPVATDLRKIFSVVQIVKDLERIADHCEDISGYTLKLADKEYMKPLIDLPKMAKEVKEMIKMTVDCYIEQDIEKAKQVCERDNVVDEYFDIIYEDLEYVMENKPEDISQGMDFLMISKYFERMADHATNIAGWVVYGM